MKKFFFMAALVAASINVNANTANTVTADTVKVDSLIIVNNDQELFNQLREADKAFEEKSNKSLPFQDVTLSYVGDDVTPHPLSRRIQRGFFLEGGVSLTGTTGLWGPKGFIGGGYEGNRWGLFGSVGFLKVRPNAQSDWQGRINAIEASFGAKYDFMRKMDNHLRLGIYGEAVFRNTFDRQDLGTYHSESVEETETEIITTIEDGWRAYAVKPYMFGAELGLELSYQLYNKPIGFYGKVGAGFTTQIAGKESVNGSADGVSYKPTCEIEVGVRIYLHKKAKNTKAKNIIKHNGSAAYYAY